MYFKKQRGSAPGLPGHREAVSWNPARRGHSHGQQEEGRSLPAALLTYLFLPHKTDKSALPPVTVTVILSLVNNASENKIGSKGYNDFWVKGIKRMELVLLGERGDDRQDCRVLEWRSMHLCSVSASLTCSEPRQHSSNKPGPRTTRVSLCFYISLCLSFDQERKASTWWVSKRILESIFKKITSANKN